jgi:hypothetical protein
MVMTNWARVDCSLSSLSIPQRDDSALLGKTELVSRAHLGRVAATSNATEVLRDDATEATEPAQQLPQQSHRSFLASLPLEFGEDALSLSADEAQPKRGNFEDLDLRK